MEPLPIVELNLTKKVDLKNKRKRSIPTNSMTIVDDTNIKKMKTTTGQKVKNSKKTEENSNKTDQVENSPQGNYAIFKKFISCLRTIRAVLIFVFLCCNYIKFCDRKIVKSHFYCHCCRFSC